MHATVKTLRQAIKHIDGARVRRWQDGQIWANCKYGSDRQELAVCIRRAGFAATIADDGIVEVTDNHN
jgi:hypothetical protein